MVESFWKSATDSGQFEVDHHSRLLNIVKTPVEADALPPDLQSLYTGLVPYEFFERDPQSVRLREFDEAFGDTALQRFHERVYDVAFDVSQVLKYLGDAAHKGEKRTANPKTINGDILAASALNAMEMNPSGPLTMYFITDDDGRPTGVLHIHDILKAGLGAE